MCPIGSVPESDFIPISALQHFVFCRRQCALIHLEGVWDENRLTAEGRLLHEKVHEGEAESRGDVRIARGIRLRSQRLGISGQADVVEFHRQPDGSWLPYPVEYKRGRPKPDTCDEIQLCAQAICLEEMLGVKVPEGAIFYGQPRRRHRVLFTPALRAQTETIAGQVHELFSAGVTPPAEYDKKCESCSIVHLCMPKTVGRRKSVARYLGAMLSEL